MFFTDNEGRAFELLMQQKPGFDRYQSGCAGSDEDCGTCRFYRPHWKYEFCVFKECPYCPGKRMLAPGGISHSGPGGNRQLWPDENSQS